MQINQSGAKSSSIIDIGVELNKKAKLQGQHVLTTQRGINAVVPIDLSGVAKYIDINSPEVQNYPPVHGNNKLKQAINSELFNGLANPDNMFVTAGSIMSLSLTFATLAAEEVCLPEFYWGAYANILKIYNKSFKTYSGLSALRENAEKYKGKAVVICEPSNPLGSSDTNGNILKTCKALSENDAVIVMDSPYRRIFFPENDFYASLLKIENLIFLESFSKFMGLSGQRIAFLHSNNPDFNREFKIRLLYASNGINGFAQQLIYHLLTKPEGKIAVNDFLTVTRAGISENIHYLKENSLLAEEVYKGRKVFGIFAAVNRSFEALFGKNIGAVNLSFFHRDKEKYKKYSRICISVKPEKLRAFFDKLK